VVEDLKFLFLVFVFFPLVDGVRVIFGFVFVTFAIFIYLCKLLLFATLAFALFVKF